MKPLDCEGSASLRRLFQFTTLLIFLQLLIAATMRHQHAGLAIRDFPLAHGRLWPATDADSIASYNQARQEITNVNPITAFQVQLQMAHRVVAVMILAAVACCAWRAWRIALIRWLAAGWLALILLQVALGAATVLTDKAADLATAHVLVGALSLASGVLLCIITGRSLATTCRTAQNRAAAENFSREEIAASAP